MHGIKTHISIFKNMLNEENKGKKLPYNYLEMDFWQMMKQKNFTKAHPPVTVTNLYSYCNWIIPAIFF